MSTEEKIEISNFEIISTPVGVCITFFALPGIQAVEEERVGTFHLSEGDLVVMNGHQEVRFKEGASSRTLQTVDELSLVGVKPSGEVVIDMDCAFERPQVQVQG